MFAKACAIAKEFTVPIVISNRKYSGECEAGIGSCVIINEDGWFVTALHIIQQLQSLYTANEQYKKLQKERDEIENDSALTKHVRMSKLGKMKIPNNCITNVSSWVGFDGWGMPSRFIVVPEIDLAIGQFLNFDKTKIKLYPFFKDPSKDMLTGSSLCKLGFPFHEIKPSFDAAKGFILPPGSTPVPLFPIDGIYTRTVNVPATKPTPIPLMFIETSTPGLRGQSGGPTFDIHGAIWAIQSSTTSYSLKFGDNIKEKTKEAEYIKNQYLNVGLGIHAGAIIAVLNEHKISYQISPY